jgi:hypothetical protein
LVDTFKFKVYYFVRHFGTYRNQGVNMDSQQVTTLELDEQSVDVDLHAEVDDELVMAISAPTSNKEWQE